MTTKAVMLLAQGEDRVLIDAQGGAIMEWTHAGQPLLCGTDRPHGDEINPLASASFPLVPYSNRIGHGRFEWAGRSQRLAMNFPPEIHAIHGVGWRRKWALERQEDNRLSLSLEHRGNEDWPWAFTARQAFTISEGTLSLELEAINLEDSPVPLAFGHHPYFPARGAALDFAANAVWLPDSEHLPKVAVPPAGDLSFQGGAFVEGRTVDHCYEGWNGNARIRWTGCHFGLEIAASAALRCAVVYIPPGGDRFCFEPVPHATNALNRSDAAQMPVIEPGKSFSARLQFTKIEQ